MQPGPWLLVPGRKENGRPQEILVSLITEPQAGSLSPSPSGPGASPWPGVTISAVVQGLQLFTHAKAGSSKGTDCLGQKGSCGWSYFVVLEDWAISLQK